MGNTALHIAILNWRRKHIVEMILQAGADLTIKNKHGRTPLEEARCEGEGIEELIILLSEPAVKSADKT